MTDIATRLIYAFRAGEIVVDLGGHHGLPSGPLTYSQVEDICGPRTDAFLDTLFGSRLWLFLLGKVPHSFDIIRDYETLDLEEKPVTLSHSQCGECGALQRVVFDGVSIRTDVSCTEPGGLKPWDLEIDVPSGRLLFRNDLRALFPKEPGDRLSVNLTAGVKACEIYYAGVGMFHVYVGNTCPSIYVLDNRVVVGRYPESEEDSRVGYVITDLWWFSACDHSRFEALGGVPEDGDTIVDLPGGPGRYRLTSNFSCFDTDTLEEYAVIQRVSL